MIGPFLMFGPRCRKTILSHLALRLLFALRGRRRIRRLLLRDELVTVAFLGEWNPVVVVACRQVLRRRKRRWRRRRVRVMVVLLLLRNLAFGGLCSAIVVSGNHPFINLGARQQKVVANLNKIYCAITLRICARYSYSRMTDQYFPGAGFSRFSFLPRRLP